METSFYFFSCAFAFIFVVAAGQHEYAKPFAENRNASYKHKRSTNPDCTSVSNMPSAGQNDCKTNICSLQGKVEEQKKEIGALTDKEKKIVKEKEDFYLHMEAAAFYLELPDKEFELTTFKANFKFPFASNAIQYIVKDIKVAVEKGEEVKKPVWATNYDWFGLFEKVRLPSWPKNAVVVSLQQLLESNSEYSNKLEQFRQSCQSFNREQLNPLHLYYNLQNNNLAVDSKFDRLKVLKMLKAILGQMIGLMLTQEACSVYDFKFELFPQKDKWDRIIDSMGVIDQQILDGWQDRVVQNDIPDYDYEKKSVEVIQNYIEPILNEKYYWNTFKVIADTRLKTNNVQDYLIDCSKKSDTTTVNYKLLHSTKDSSRPVYLVWSSFKHSKEYKVDIVEKEPPTSSPATTEQPGNNYYERTAKFSDLTGAAGEAVKGLGKNVEALNTFKNVLKGIGAFAKYAGPIGSAIASILSAFLESGTVDIMNALKDGFDKVHEHLDEIEAKIDKLGEVVKLENYQQTYREVIRDPVIDMKALRKRYFRNPCQPSPLASVWQRCTTGLKPHELLSRIENYFKPADFVPKIFDAAEYNINHLRKHLIRFVYDASELADFYMTVCFPLMRDSPAHKAAVSTSNAHHLSNIINEANKFDNIIMQDWPTKMEEEVEKDLKAATDETDKQELAQLIQGKLAAKYYWNEFHVTTFKNKIGRHFYNGIRQQRIIHPGYSRHFHTEVWDVIINWRAKLPDAAAETQRAQRLSNTVAKITDKLNQLSLTCGYDDLGVSTEFLESLKAIQDVKTVFIRKDHHKSNSGIIHDNVGKWPNDEINYAERYCNNGGSPDRDYYKRIFVFNYGD